VDSGQHQQQQQLEQQQQLPQMQAPAPRPPPQPQSPARDLPHQQQQQQQQASAEEPAPQQQQQQQAIAEEPPPEQQQQPSQIEQHSQYLREVLRPHLADWLQQQSAEVCVHSFLAHSTAPELAWIARSRHLSSSTPAETPCLKTSLKAEGVRAAAAAVQAAAAGWSELAAVPVEALLAGERALCDR
jgi:hypothetical protein